MADDTPRVLLSKLTWHDVRKTAYEVAVLPWGATEAHNFHLPYATDNYQVEWVAREAATEAARQGASIVVLPTIPFGVNTQQLDIPLTINMNPSTQAMVLADIVDSLESSAVRKLVILNGHGGNDFKQMVRELQAATDLFLSVVNWYAVEPAGGYFQHQGDHAGEMETSVMLHIEPDLVGPLSEAGEGKANRFTLEGLRDGTAWAPRQWTKVTADTGVGNPYGASQEKGVRYLKAVSERIARYLAELSDADPDALFEAPTD